MVWLESVLDVLGRALVVAVAFAYFAALVVVFVGIALVVLGLD